MKIIRKNLFLIVYFLFPLFAIAQTPRVFVSAANTSKINLYHYNGLKMNKAPVQKNEPVAFLLPEDYSGAGLLKIDNSEYIVLLADKEINIKVGLGGTVEINSVENNLVDRYYQDKQLRERKLSGLTWLLPLYEQDSTQNIFTTIQGEIKRLGEEEEKDFNAIPDTSYASYYVFLKNLTNNIPASLSRYPERIPGHITDFFSLDFNDERLYHSGLLASLLENFVVLCESAGAGTPGLDSIYRLLYTVNDHIFTRAQEHIVNEIGHYLLKLYEKRSLIKAAEHLGLLLTSLSEEHCRLDDDVIRRAEQYRKMKVGNTAPEIIFNAPVKNAATLSDISSDYKLVWFWASWCNHCREELPLLNELSDMLTAKGISVVAISLDTDIKDYQKTLIRNSWYHYCDFNGWESKPVIDYHVFSTPSYYLLDKNNKIVFKPASAKHLEAFLKNR
jgi:thiol-disulfide isomerase/thioredoxin